MINRAKVQKVIDAVEGVQEFCDVHMIIDGSGEISVYAAPRNWGASLTKDDRQKVLALLTPLVGRLDKKNEDTSIHYEGQADGISVKLRRADTCQIVGYKKRIRSIPKMETRTIEKEEEVETGEYAEEEELIPITDCEIRMGKASEADIEIPA